MAAVRREIKEVEKQFEEAELEYQDVSKQLKVVQQDRMNTEEELMVGAMPLLETSDARPYARATPTYPYCHRVSRALCPHRILSQAANMRLKQLLGELQAQQNLTTQQTAGTVQDNQMTMDELSRKVESALMQVLDEKFRDEAFTSAITEQSSLASTDKVRVEFDGDEVYWSLNDNYTFEMLLQDAARYWDVAAQDAILVDERGAM